MYRTAGGWDVTLVALDGKFWRPVYCHRSPGVRGYHKADDAAICEKQVTELADVFRPKTRDEWESSLADEESKVASKTRRRW
ncbi:hypothetical protein [Natrinema halophilum]|uniref:hypothetical protein n=1 Tax=Natrinema halophilum TaxID=1699371 RepID=UPI001F3CDFA7|nr:hypothetical protein [Natrinema halophilum]UHQ96281.1 hypothetical protein HYG82_21715 [Natrinema halophilum]